MDSENDANFPGKFSASRLPSLMASGETPKKKSQANYAKEMMAEEERLQRWSWTLNGGWGADKSQDKYG